MSEEDTYIRAKLTDINVAIERLTEMLNRMIDVMSKITEVQEATSDVALNVAANSQKLDELMRAVQSVSTGGFVAATSSSAVPAGAASEHTAVLEALDSQIREGVIASDLAKKINDTADTLEERGAPSSLTVKMKRWTRILKTYGRVDTISPVDLSKLRNDLKKWQIELGKR
ncbi:MAG: hypothetical protein ACW97A_05795 [Candidatus Thorarchaeota archaeon]|jgi:hypothetical protein